MRGPAEETIRIGGELTKNLAGRNDPCPCGSGRKYKHCCLNTTTAPPRRPGAGDVAAELRRILEGQGVQSLEEAQKLATAFMQRRNQAPLDDFQGLSPEQMQRILHLPFATPQWIRFAARVDSAAAAPIMTLLRLLAEAIGTMGLKATAKGNLPRNFCREAALAYWGELAYRKNTRIAGLNREEDFDEMHVTRLVAGLAGLIRKYKGRFLLTREGRRLVSAEGMGEAFPRLLRAYAEGFNWGYLDLFPELRIVQQSFAFSLYLLSRYGDRPRSAVFFEDAFLRAFPMAVGEVPPNPVYPPERLMRDCYTVRTLVSFAGFLGLAVVEPVPSDPHPARDYQVAKQPLLDEAVQFHLPK
jgi:hypothetical protein